jgi:hypothetical protein
MTRRSLLVLILVLGSGCSQSEPPARLSRKLGPSSGMVISQIYGGGGNSNALLTYDYVELFNRGTSLVNLNGWSVQYTSYNGTTWSQMRALPNVDVPGGHYFLLQLASQNTGVGSPLPVTADDTGGSNPFNMSATHGKLALLNSASACANPCSSQTAVVDFVGFGSDATEFESAPAQGASDNNQALVRKGVGCIETDHNDTDFELQTWTSPLGSSIPLHNSSSAAHTCATPDAGVEASTPDITVTVDSLAPDTAPTADTKPAADTTSTADQPPPPPPAGTITISQVYGGGGNASASYTNDYVELFNRGTTAVPIGGWSVQYGPATSAFSQKADIPAGASIAPGRYFLVQLASTANVGSALPTPDFAPSSPYNISASAGKVALVTNTTQLTCGASGNRCTSTAIMDMIGYGSTATDYEGAVAPAPSTNTDAMFRLNGGCTDNNTNNADFQVSPAAPRNSATAQHSCTASVDSGVPDVVTTVDKKLTDTALPKDTTVVVTDTKPADVAKVDAPKTDVAKPVDLSGTEASVPPAHVISISQVYGAGGNSGASYTNDYMELFNRSAVAVSIGGWSVQYGSSTGAFSQKADLPSSASIAPWGYYLVQLASSGAVGVALPTADFAPTGTNAFNLSASAGKVALVRNTTLLTCGAAGSRCASALIEDLVGYGGASDYEGSATTTAPSAATMSLFRKNGGCTDTNDNAADFSTATAAARNSSSAKNNCTSLPDSGPAKTDAAPKKDSSVKKDTAVTKKETGAVDAPAVTEGGTTGDGAPIRVDSKTTKPGDSGGCACELAATAGGADLLLPSLGLALVALLQRRRRRR